MVVFEQSGIVVMECLLDANLRAIERFVVEMSISCVYRLV